MNDVTFDDIIDRIMKTIDAFYAEVKELRAKNTELERYLRDARVLSLKQSLEQNAWRRKSLELDMECTNVQAEYYRQEIANIEKEGESENS
jgi:hypothetical protein